MVNSTSLQIQEQIRRADKIFLTAHKNPDGDALGCLLSFLLYLQSLNKEVVVFLNDVLPQYFDFLPSFESITHDVGVLSSDYDLAIVFDCRDLERTDIKDSFFSDKKVINIDHHDFNPGFGDLNLVDVKASAACEIVFSFFKDIDFVSDSKIATCLLTGILDDTGGLTNGATADSAIKACVDLIYSGARFNLIAKKIFSSKSFSGLKVWGLILSRLEVNRDFGLAHTYISDEELESYRVSSDEIDGLVNFLNVLSDVKAVAFFRIQKYEIRVSLRTTRDDVDVSALAGIFNGGGHRKASGFTVPLTDISLILEKIGPKV